MATCAPGRGVEYSPDLRRRSCLTHGEVSLAIRKGGTVSDSDKSLGERIDVEPIRPRKPPHWMYQPRAWLSNLDIDAVSRQYESVYPDFSYLGSHPVDLSETTRGGACVSLCDTEALCEVARRGKVGVLIVNLDVHTGPGTHWTALVIDHRVPALPKITYYDPTGRSPPRRWIPGTWGLIAAASPRSERRRVIESIRHGTRAHQRGRTECGQFCLLLLDFVAKGGDAREFCSKSVDDDDAFRARRLFFS